MEDIEKLVKFLKTLPSGPPAVKAILERTLIQINSLKSDPMTHRVMQYLPEIPEGNVLDVGCFGGWLYHALGKPKGYIGIDTWPEAIDVAKTLAPEADFRLCNAFDFKDPVDFVWCSQIIWGPKAGQAYEHLKAIGRKGIMLLVRSEAASIGEYDNSGHLGIIRW